MPVCLIAFGSNLGDRHTNFDEALERLSGDLGAEAVESRRLVTVPVGGPGDQEEFLNSVVRLSTNAPPLHLLATLKAIERSYPAREGRRWASRALDLDLLLVDDVVINEPELRLPHPRMSFRPFIIGPAAELAPDWEHPEIGATLGELRQRLTTADRLLTVVGEGGEVERCLSLAKRAIANKTGIEVEHAARAGLQGPPPGLTIDVAKASVRCRGPRLRIADCDPGRLAEEIRAAVECVWPDRS